MEGVKIISSVSDSPGPSDRPLRKGRVLYLPGQNLFNVLSGIDESKELSRRAGWV